MKKYKYMLNSILVLVLLVLLIMPSPVAALTQPAYTITDLGTLRSDGTGSSSALGINEGGVVVGVADTSDGYRRAFLRESGKGMVDLMLQGVTLGGDNSIGWALSNDYQTNSRYIAGEASTPANPASSSHAFVLGPHGIIDLNGLGAFSGGQNGNAAGVNSNGQVAGKSQIQSGVFHAFKYDQLAGGMVDLGTLGGPTSRANGINSQGEVVGAADKPGGASWGVCWSPQRGTVQISFTNSRQAEAFAINDKSVVAGTVWNLSKQKWGFIYDLGSQKTTVLSRLAGATLAEALAINNNGDIVGTSGKNVAVERAVIWQNGKIADLNTLIPKNSGWVLQVASGINDAGQVVGTGMYNGNPRAFLLQPFSPATGTGYQLSVQPASSWTLDAGEINSPCTPPNPYETKFSNATTPGGPGVARFCASDTLNCCTCTRRSKSFPLPAVLNTSTSRLRGYFVAQRGSNDVYSVGSMRVDLYLNGSLVAKRLYASENRPNNNCAGTSELPETLLPPPLFNIDLSTIAPGAQFNEVIIRLNGYACGTATNEIYVAELEILTQ
jgi:probable HAF family extracellular repeat protein